MAVHDPGAAAYQKSITEPTPLNPALAARRMREVKAIFDRLGVVFWLGSGTCLGAVREGGFIPWDDETDTASVIGLHGLTERRFDEVVREFESAGFYAHVGKNPRHNGMSIVRDGLRTDWTVHHIVHGYAWEFPGVKLPLDLFRNLQTIEFVGEEFRIPSPPEEYLALKYGPLWRTPKGPGFEDDVVNNVRDGAMLTMTGKLARLLFKHIMPSRATWIRVFDRQGVPVPRARIKVAGADYSDTDSSGYARLYIPGKAYYAVVVTFGEHREVLYEEVLIPGGRYEYRPGPIVTVEEHYKAGVRAMALTEE